MCGILINVNLLLWKWRRGSAWYLISFLGPGSIWLCRKIYTPFLTAWLSSKLCTHECPWKLSLYPMHAYPKKKEGRRCCHLKQKGLARLHRYMKWVVEGIEDWLCSSALTVKTGFKGRKGEQKRGPWSSRKSGQFWNAGLVVSLLVNWLTVCFAFGSSAHGPMCWSSPFLRSGKWPSGCLIGCPSPLLPGPGLMSESTASTPKVSFPLLCNKLPSNSVANNNMSSSSTRIRSPRKSLAG